MNKPKSQIMIEKVRKHERVTCPKCNDGVITAKGKPETSLYFYCSNKKCDAKIILN